MSDKLHPKRYETNPFLPGMLIPIRDRSVKLSRLGKDDNVLVNQQTGEIGGTHITTYRKVDSEQFVKIFTANIALTFSLGSAGIKAFNVLLWAVQERSMGKDQVDMDSYALDEFLKDNSHREPPVKLSPASLKRGLRELEKAKILARTMRPGRYFINPSFVFNGDRIAFSTVIERSAAGEKEQLDLPI